MNLGIGLGVTNYLRVPTVPLDPDAAIAALFQTGTPGVYYEGAWYDPSDLSTMYQDAAGTTPVTAAGQPVGLTLDKSKGLTLGAELWPTGTITVQAGWTDNGDGSYTAATATSDLVYSNTGITINKLYQYTLTVLAYTSGDIRAGSGGTGTYLNISGPGVYSVYSYQLPATGGNAVFTGVSFVGTISSLSVRELPGNHAKQTTSAARPVLQTSGGLWYLDFDGVDDYMQTAPTGFASTSDAMIAFAGNGDTASLINSIGLSSGSYQSQTDWISLRLQYLGNTEFNTNKANTARYYAVQPYPGAVPTVYLGYVDGLTVFLRLNANETTATRPTVYSYNVTQEIDIGALDVNGTITQWSNINFYGGIIRMVAPSPAEIASVESYLGTKSGFVAPEITGVPTIAVS